MNKEKPYRDQAERLRKKLEKVEQIKKEPEELPPRSRLHRKKKKKRKLQFPAIQLLVLFFVLLPVIIFAVYPYLEGMVGRESTGVREGYETISLEEKPRKKSQPVKIEEKEEETASDKDEVEPDPEPEASSELGHKPESPAVEGKDGTSEKQTEPKRKEKAELKENDPVQEETAEAKIILHTVTDGENLFRISLKYYQSQAGMEIIRKANNLPSDEIKLGQVLKIPIEN